MERNKFKAWVVGKLGGICDYPYDAMDTVLNTLGTIVYHYDSQVLADGHGRFILYYPVSIMDDKWRESMKNGKNADRFKHLSDEEQFLFEYIWDLFLSGESKYGKVIIKRDEWEKIGLEDRKELYARLENAFKDKDVRWDWERVHTKIFEPQKYRIQRDLVFITGCFIDIWDSNVAPEEMEVATKSSAKRLRLLREEILREANKVSKKVDHIPPEELMEKWVEQWVEGDTSHEGSEE
jgi:hypothetical protein